MRSLGRRGPKEMRRVGQAGPSGGTAYPAQGTQTQPPGSPGVERSVVMGRRGVSG